jgi:photosystem II stability/assembly factor-like uncharacterized protein
MKRLLPLLAILPLALLWETPDPETGEHATTIARRLPPPTVHRLDPDAERRNHDARKKWIEQIHRTAPGVDWRAIERQNGLDRMERRKELLAQRTLPSPAWTEVGSRNLAGRMHVAALSADGDSLYAGSSRGGVWKADLHGAGWRPLSDNLYGGTHGLAIAAGPPETITRITDGGLLHYSEDGGQTWHVPAGPVQIIMEGKRVFSDPADPHRVYLIVRKPGGFWRLYRSDDRGKSYTRIRNLGAFAGDIWIDRQVGGSIYCLEGVTLHRSDNLGATWEALGSISSGNPSDVVLAGSEAGSPAFYAALRGGGGWDLHRSTDGGATWEWRYSINDFWETLNASITDPNVVLFGGVELYRSVNGGASFSLVNEWFEYYEDPVNMLHADLPGLDVIWTPQGEEIFYIATDGGLYRSDDRVANVANISLEYLAVSQYYSTHTSVNDPTLILAGSQDQGYQRSTGPAIGNWRDFDQLISGDYGHLTSSDGTHARVLSVYPGFVLVQEGELNPELTDFLDFPAGENYGIWMPYILADPDDAKAFYFCATHLNRYRKLAHLWSITQELQDFTVNGGSFATALAISPVDHDRRLVVTDTGVLWFSTDGGASWTVSPDTGPSDYYLYGNALAFSNTDPTEAYVGGSGYSAPGVYRTTDGGVSWTAVGSGLPSTQVIDLAYEPGPSGVLYAATDAGPYRLNPITDTWQSIDGLGAPLTTFWSVEAVPAAGVMRFGTYGRGIWDFHVNAVTSVEDLEIAATAIGLPPVVNYPNPFRSTTTLRFAIERPGAVRLRVYDTAGRLVRTLTEEVRSAGEHRVSWDGRDADGNVAAAGIYMARLESEDGVATRTMLRLR